MTVIAGLVGLVAAEVYPPLTPFAIATTVNVFMWRRRAAIIRADRDRHGAKKPRR